METSSLARIRQALQSPTRVVLTTHMNPDGDAVGSELALGRYLRGLGKSVSIINHDATPSFYAFLDPDHFITQFDPHLHRDIIGKAELIVVLDANQAYRVGALEPLISSSSALKMCIDHHRDPMPFADIALIDQNAAATAELVFHLLVSSEATVLPKEIAEPLYVAIMTDTGSFRFSGTSPSLHRTTAHLIEWGADPALLYQRVYEEGTPQRVRLLGRALATLDTAAKGRIAHIRATQQMFAETATSEADTENFINHLLGIKGVVVGLMFIELPDVVKVSFRSKGEIPVNKLAQQFGGNGHRNAAGAKVRGESIDTVARRVIEAAVKFLEP